MIGLDTKIGLIYKIASDYSKYSSVNENIPAEKEYKITSLAEDRSICREARLQALEELRPSKIKKFAFDTRKTNQENTRNPRKNLQYWHRSDAFITKEDENILKTYSKLAKVLKKLKDKFGTSPEWFDSYSRQLYDNVYRILRVKEADFDIFRPQLNYLEQLIFARYRLSMENLEKFSSQDLEDRILSKDEELIGRNNYLKEIQSSSDEDNTKYGISQNKIISGQDKTTQESIVNAIFGTGADFRKDGERTVERTITIKITDNVID